jgi:hypothetical protein
MKKNKLVNTNQIDSSSTFVKANRFKGDLGFVELNLPLRHWGKQLRSRMSTDGFYDREVYMHFIKNLGKILCSVP